MGFYTFNALRNLQDHEVTYFQAYIDGVDFVFIDSPVFRHIENIYGGNRVVSSFSYFTRNRRTYVFADGHTYVLYDHLALPCL